QRQAKRTANVLIRLKGDLLRNFILNLERRRGALSAGAGGTAKAAYASGPNYLLVCSGCQADHHLGAGDVSRRIGLIPIWMGPLIGAIFPEDLSICRNPFPCIDLGLETIGISLFA